MSGNKEKFHGFAAIKIQSLFRGAMARSKFKRMRLRHVARQFDLLEEREVVFSRKKRVEAKEDFKKKIEAIRRDLLRTEENGDTKSRFGQQEVLPECPPSLSRGHTDFKAVDLAKKWTEKEKRQIAAAAKAEKGGEEQKNRGRKAKDNDNDDDSAKAAAAAPKNDDDDIQQEKKKEEEEGESEEEHHLHLLPISIPPLVKADSTPGKNLSSSEQINLDFVTAMMDRFKAGEILDEETALRLIKEAAAVLVSEANVKDVVLPKGARCVIVGDLHGQLDDLIHIFTLNGLPSSRNKYIFNGDFVDRGKNSCEVVLILFALKILYPESVFLNRGNHEATDINEEMGFCAECTRKYNRDMWKRFSDAFQHLPLASVVQDEIFVVHGGLCWEDITMKDILDIDRHHLFAPYETNMEDLLWSDPLDVDDDTGLPFRGRGKNSVRNDAGCVFGEDVVDRFMADNKLSLVVRSHECVDAGYEWYFDEKLVTVFSASRYRGKDDNLGSVMLISSKGSSSEKEKKKKFLPDQDTKSSSSSYYGYQGGAKFGETKKLQYRFIQYEAEKRHAKNSHNFCLRYGSQENKVLTLMIKHISKRRLKLIHHFDEVSSSKKNGGGGLGKGYVTRTQWKAGLNKAIGVNIPWLSFQEMLGVPAYGVDGSFRGPLDYMEFLSRFTPLYRHLKEEISGLDEGKKKKKQQQQGATSSSSSSTEDNEEDNDKKEKQQQGDKHLNHLLGNLLEAADRSGVRNIESLFR